MPHSVHFLQAAQQKAPQSPSFLDQPIHRLHNRLPLGVDRPSLLASELAGNAALDVGIFGYRSAFGLRWLPVRESAGGDEGFKAELLAVACVVLAPVARIHGHRLWQGPSVGSDAQALNRDQPEMALRTRSVGTEAHGRSRV